MTSEPTAEERAHRWFGLRVEYEMPRLSFGSGVKGAVLTVMTSGLFGDKSLSDEPMPDGFADVVVYRKDTGEAVDVVAFPTLNRARARIDRIETLLDAEAPEVFCNELGIGADAIEGPGQDREAWELTVEWIATKSKHRRPQACR